MEESAGKRSCNYRRPSADGAGRDSCHISSGWPRGIASSRLSREDAVSLFDNLQP